MRDGNFIRMSFVLLSTCLLFIQMYCVIVIVLGGNQSHTNLQKNEGLFESPEISKLRQSLFQTKEEEESDKHLAVVLNKMQLQAKKIGEPLIKKNIKNSQKDYPKEQESGKNVLLKDLTKYNTEIPFRKFNYSSYINIDMKTLLMKVKAGQTIDAQQVNLYGGKNIHAPWRRCAALRKNVFVVFIIKSFAINFERRKAIRQTWSNESLAATIPFKRIFLIGSPQNPEVQSRIDAEQEQNRDMVEVSVNDNIHNSTVKTLRGLNWAVSFCSKSRYYMMIQDDLFVATETLLQKLTEMSRRQTLNYAGFVHRNRSPNRDEKSPWFISVENYPFDKYPDFVFGGALLLSYNFSRDILLAAKYTKCLSIDDVYIGILAYKLGVIPQKIDSIEIEKEMDFLDDEFENILISRGYGNEDRLKSAWIAYKSVLNDRKSDLYY